MFVVSTASAADGLRAARGHKLGGSELFAETPPDSGGSLWQCVSTFAAPGAALCPGPARRPAPGFRLRGPLQTGWVSSLLKKQMICIPFRIPQSAH